MLNRTVIKGYLGHPDPDYLVALYRGLHDFDSIEDAEDELSELELEALEEGMIERGEL